jgi:DNA-binding CsgD family transcriptional regulator
MSKSNRVRLKDMRDIGRLVAECREVGTDVNLWGHRLCEGLAELIPTRTVTCGLVTPAVVQGGSLPMPGTAGISAVGFEQGRIREMYRAFHKEQMTWTDPSFTALSKVGGRLAVCRRRELVDDATWYRSPHYQDYYRACRVDDCILSMARPEPTAGVAFMFLNINRTLGDQPCTIRERRMVRLLLAEIVGLLGMKLAVTNEPGNDGLTPRLRQVLQCLREGDGEKQVAQRLGISPHTVHMHINRLHRRFGVSSRSELLAASRLLVL